MTSLVADKDILGNGSFDGLLAVVVLALIVVGFVGMSSASIEFSAEKYGDPFFHMYRYLFHLSIGLIGGLIVYRIPMSFWQRTGWMWLCVGFLLLVLVLIPGGGREVNGSQRWLGFGPITIQSSELMKGCMIIYLAGYLVRRQDEVREEWRGFVKPMVVLFVATLLLMLEPDFGATVVTVGTAFGMIFLAGVRLWQFLLVIMASVAALLILIVSEPYRMKRLTAFTDPWADQFDTGYQLTQALIAFGRGEWFGVGLGNSIQKLFYLPEAHTDFVFAIFAEEFGVVGALTVMSLFCCLVVRVMSIGRSAELNNQLFNAYIAYGVALMIGGQVFINIGVNIGLLPTKGLTLPFISYGGTSLIVCCGLMALIFRVSCELNAVKRESLKLPAKKIKRDVRAKAAEMFGKEVQPT
jgi:cell division protein FtsW